MQLYIESIEFKLKSAKYHRDMCLESIDRPIKFDNDDDQLVAISSEFTAMMLTLQSILDSLAQLINEKRKVGLNKSTLYLSTLIEHQDNLSDIVPLLDKIVDEFKYISAYCNTTKHRNLIKISDDWYYISPFQVVRYHMVESFERNSQYYEQKGLRDLLVTYYEEVTLLITDILKIVLKH